MGVEEVMRVGAGRLTPKVVNSGEGGGGRVGAVVLYGGFLLVTAGKER
jgi:hypothetical protein